MSPAPFSRHLPWLLGGLLVLGCMWIYRDTTGFGFVGLDDDYNIIFNPHLGPPTLARVQWAFTDVDYSRRYQPLGWLGFSVVFGFAGLNPAGYHAAGLVLHCLNALLVAAVLGRFVGREAGSVSAWWRAMAVFLAAAFWAWHPLRVESVAWASGLLYEQATLFMLAALWFQLGADSAYDRRHAAAVGCYALALLTYPAALGLWPVLVLLDVRRAGWRTALRRNLDHAAIALMVLAVTVLARFQVVGEWPAAPGWAEFPLWQRVVQTLYVWGHYLWRPWWPVGLSPVDPVLLNLADPSWRVLGGGGLVLALAVFFLVASRARAAAGGFFLAYLAVLVPVLGFVEKPHFPSDRYAFLPQLVMAGGLVLLMARVPSRRAAVGAVSGAVLVFFAFVSRAQTAIWRDEPTLWRHIESRLSVNDSPVLACARPALSLLRAGDGAGALALIDSGLRERPDDAMLLSVRAEIVGTDHENRTRAASLGLASPPPLAAVLHHALAVQLAKAGDAEAAARHLQEVGRLAPEYLARITRAPAAPVPGSRAEP